MFADAGFSDPVIVASNDLDEMLISDIKHQGARINSWGVGTHLITSRNFPALGGVYKLAAIHDKGRWIPRIKMSSSIEKLTNPGRKQIYRLLGRSGSPLGDYACEVEEPPPDPGRLTMYHQVFPLKKISLQGVASAAPLLRKTFDKGKFSGPGEDLDVIRRRVQEQIAMLPQEMLRLRNPDRYPVGLSPVLAEMKRGMIEKNGSVF
jgi:nicotinate phosphoribosyltransferase